MDFNQLLEQAQKVQDQLGKNMEELNSKEFEVNTNGAITVKIKGDYTITSISIDKDALEDKEMLESMLVACINKALDKIKKEQENIQQNISIPGIF